MKGGDIHMLYNLITILITIMANVASYYICKWLDSYLDN